MALLRKLCWMTMACAILSSAGCVWSLGGGETKKVVQPSQGAQLSDLKKARDEGAITDEEYQSMKKKILEQTSP
jgi:hypothetical protein